ncbi:class I SAM-dependent methyltransferase, partial [Bacillus sp. GbtcB15]
MPDIKAALGEIRRIIKPGGMFVLLEWEAVESEIGPS